ncbi:MAG: hypothetical protein ABH824_05895 [Nanoarchaeota archaeon]
MLNKKEFNKIRDEIVAIEKKREFLIRKSRDIITLSKQIIYSLHRNDISAATPLMIKIKKEKSALQKIGTFTDTNIDKTALQEYVEAATYYEFIKNNKIPTKQSLGITAEEYLLGICDLTGELVRRAVSEVINKRFDNAVQIKDLVEEIYGEFIKFNLRNGELRKKSDSIRWNLKKLEEVIYDFEIKRK